MGVTIRAAEAGDTAQIMAFIHALAAFEKMSDEVRSNAADIARDLFGPAPRVFCDLAEADGQPVGFALWYYTYSTFAGAHGIYLEDLYVDEAQRGTGAGFALMKRLARRCAEEGLGRLEWSVLDWNSVALDFYDRIGAVPPTGWLGRRLSGEALRKLGQG